MLNKLWDAIIRWRTALFNGIGGLVVLVLPLFGAPEVLAVIPTPYHKWVYVSVFVINWWMRPRAASRQSDPEMVVKNMLKTTENATVVVTEGGQTKAVVEQAK